jgi:hypothetical protein
MEDRGDILIRGLWVRGTNCIIDVRSMDVDAKLNRSKDPDKVLATHEQEKKKKYLEACLKAFLHLWSLRTDSLAKKPKLC